MSRIVTPPPLDFSQLIKEKRFLGLWTMLKGYRGLYLAATISVGIAAVLRTSFYYLLGYYTDTVLLNDNAQVELIVIALTFVGLAVLQGIFIFLSGRWSAAAAEGATLRLRNFLYDHIQRLPFAYHDRTPTGDLIQRSTSDVDAVRRFYAEQALGVGRITLLFLVNFIALITLDWKLALVSIVLVPFVLLSSVLFFSRIAKRYEAFQEQEAKLSTTLQENLTGIRVVKAFARQSFEEDKFEADNKERFNRGKRLLMMHAFYWPTTDIIVGAQMLIGYFAGAMMAINGAITVGMFLTYMGLLGWIVWPMRHLGRLIVQMSSGVVSFGRIMEVVEVKEEDLENSHVQPTDELRGEIIFDNVSFEYGDGTAVLHNISFQCQPGQVVALIGSTGSGKTSLINLLPRFYDYTNGSIKLDGVELSDYSRHYLRQHIGLVLQEPFLFSRTIRDNITYGVGRELTKEEIEEASRAAAIHDVILTFPNGYDTLVGEKGVTLSGGQKQRITIARTLLKDPRILILDDATSSVDTETEADIRTALDNLMPGRTNFIIAHRIQTVMNADLILVLENGRIIQCGQHEELLSQPGTYQRIFNLQAQIEEELEQELASINV